MIIFDKWKGYPLTISSKSNSLTISLEYPDSTLVYSFDKNGRLWTALKDGVAYRRGLNGSIVAKWNSGGEVLHRKWLNQQESEELLQDAHQLINQIYQSMDQGKREIENLNNFPLKQEVEEISHKDLNFYNQNVIDYHKVYKPVGILPPDQYMSVVLQLTEGCSFNTCTFCNFYRDRPFKIKTNSEFEDHIRKVKSFLGNSLNLRRTIFLGDANALVVPQKIFLPQLDLIHKHLDVETLGGLFAFLDGFSGEKKTYTDYRDLQAKGFKRIYIGMESGNNLLLQFLRKPGKAEDVLNAVRVIKNAEISVAIIILLGAGGIQFQEEHVNDTIDLINKMNLDADDIIYFSELIENEGIEYAQKAYQANLQPLTSSERVHQGELISTGLHFSNQGTPHISRYDIRDFVY